MGRLWGRIVNAVRRIPRRVRTIVIVTVAVAGGFAAVVLPLFTAGRGETRAEVAGQIADSTALGQAVEVALAIDNVGGTIIDPLCLRADFDLPVEVQSVRFQGVSTVPFSNGHACGARGLTGDETISVRIVLVPRRAGTLHITFTAAQGDRTIGPPRRLTTDVVAQVP